MKGVVVVFVSLSIFTVNLIGSPVWVNSSLAVILISFSYVAVLQNKVNATEELLALEQEEAQLRMEIKEDEDGWRVDEYWKTECVESFEKSQFNRHTRNDKRSSSGWGKWYHIKTGIFRKEWRISEMVDI